MTSANEDQPVCFDCKHNDQGFPCRDAAANFNADKLARMYLFAYQERESDKYKDRNHWSFDCVSELSHHWPELGFEFVLVALKYFSTNDEMAYLAAGPLENLVIDHGPLLIEPIEQEARQNQRFRQLLSGVWGELFADPDVWRRVQNILENGPQLD